MSEQPISDPTTETIANFLEPADTPHPINDAAEHEAWVSERLNECYND